MKPTLRQSRISLHREFIKYLLTIKPSQRRAVIDRCHRGELDCLSEIFDNFLKKHLTTNKKIIKKLQPHRRIIRELALKKTPLKKKRSILSSPTGGSILGLILPIAASLLGSIFK